jgi:hypothetical protein
VLWVFNPIKPCKLKKFFWLDLPHQVNSDNVTWVIKIPCVVLLFLKNIDLILSSLYCRCDVLHFVMALFLVVGGSWHFPLSRLSAVYFDLPKLWPHVFKADSVKSYASNLDLQSLILAEISCFVDIRVELIFDNEVHHLLVLIPSSRFHFLRCQLWQESRWENRCYWLTQRVHLSKLA